MESKLLIDGLQADNLTIDEASSTLDVSSASVRNWIRTGYLTRAGRNLIDKASFEKFAREVAGREKLTKRANKSMLDSHDHEELSRGIREKLTFGAGHDLAELGDEYAETLSNAYRNREGVYYTPPEIARSFFASLTGNMEDLTFLDPCCGSGNFLVAAVEAGLHPANIYGFDADPVAVDISKARLGALAPAAASNVVHRDFLDVFINGEVERSIDVIFTNPPWGGKVKKRIRDYLCTSLDLPKSVDSSALFFCACEQLTAEGGFLGMLLPDAFFSVASFQKSRETALRHQIVQMNDHGKVFRTLLTKAKSLTIRKTRPEQDAEIPCTVGGRTYIRSQKSFQLNPKSIFNIGCTPEESAVISSVFALPHINLRDHASWGLGIVTGNNKRFVKHCMERGHIPVFRGSDIHEKCLKEPTSFIPADLSLYQQVAPVDLFEAPEKIVYRFISSRLVFFLDTKQRYFLNSANMLIPDEDFPVRAPILVQYLNSRFVNWLFGKIFMTHKILRADLEQIPVFPDLLQSHEEFDEKRFLDDLGIVEVDDGTCRSEASYRICRDAI